MDDFLQIHSRKGKSTRIFSKSTRIFGFTAKIEGETANKNLHGHKSQANEVSLTDSSDFYGRWEEILQIRVISMGDGKKFYRNRVGEISFLDSPSRNEGGYFPNYYYFLFKF